MGKYLRISSYIRKPLLIYGFASDPSENFVFFFISAGRGGGEDRSGIRIWTMVLVFLPVKMSRARQVVFCRLVQYLPDGEALRSASLLLRRRAEQAQLSLRWSEAQRM
jgi:hypothetical protein